MKYRLPGSTELAILAVIALICAAVLFSAPTPAGIVLLAFPATAVGGLMGARRAGLLGAVRPSDPTDDDNA